jgi:membrane-bound serine protease (ClpP class)
MKAIITGAIVFLIACVVVDVVLFNGVARLLEAIADVFDPRGRSRGRDITREVPRQNLNAIVGRDGIAETYLKPSGYVLLDGKRHEATTEGGFLESGERVTIVRIQRDTLVVRKA